METHMTTLGATLLAINRRQAAARRRTRKGIDATPFTTAVLNRERLDVITYIRDADHHTEANLFWYPPPPQSQPSAAPSQYAQRQALQSTSSTSASHQYPHQRHPHPKQHRTAERGNANTLETQEVEQLLAPRVPEPRNIQPPTPLRQTLSSRNRGDLPGGSGGAGSDDHATDIRTLLLAAQKLNDNYRSAPKARKHIKGLLKKHAELAKTVLECEQRSQANEARIRSIRDAKADGGVAPSTFAGQASLAAKDGRSSETQDELARIREATHKEELEILALEELLSELKQEVKAKRSAKSNTVRGPAAAATLTSSGAGPSVRAPSQETTTPSTSDLPQRAPALHNDTPIASGSDVLEGTSAATDSEAEADTTAADNDAANDGDETATIRLAPAAPTSDLDDKVAPEVEEGQAEEEAVEPDPESSAELERVTSNVWRLFGDGLRHVAPDCDAASFHETLRLLRLLISGGLYRHSSSSGGGGAGDTSLTSTHTSSTQTSQLTTDSTTSTGPSTVAYSPDTVMTAYVILQMLCTAPPHQVNIEELKVKGHEWWSEKGREAFEKATRLDEVDDRPTTEVPTDGQNLARKSVYGMVSKQLFTLKRMKGVGTIEFA